jgi:DNA-binding MarR family transcriptional regulator
MLLRAASKCWGEGEVTSDDELQTADEIGSQLVRLVRLIERVQAQYQAEHPDAVDRATYLLLVHLAKDGARRAGALAEAVHSDPSTVSRQVAHLVGLGLVERVADPADGRATLLVATDEGRRVFDENRQLRNRRIAGLMAPWPDDDRRAFARLLARFTEAFECHKARAPEPAHPASGGPAEPARPAHP